MTNLITPESNPITSAINIIGLGVMASSLGVSYQAIRKWEVAGRLPRTEWTGETNYAEKIEIAASGKIKKADLLTLPAKKI